MLDIHITDVLSVQCNMADLAEDSFVLYISSNDMAMCQTCEFDMQRCRTKDLVVTARYAGRCLVYICLQICTHICI